MDLHRWQVLRVRSDRQGGTESELVSRPTNGQEFQTVVGLTDLRMQGVIDLAHRGRLPLQDIMVVLQKNMDSGVNTAGWGNRRFLYLYEGRRM